MSVHSTLSFPSIIEVSSPRGALRALVADAGPLGFEVSLLNGRVPWRARVDVEEGYDEPWWTVEDVEEEAEALVGRLAVVDEEVSEVWEELLRGVGELREEAERGWRRWVEASRGGVEEEFDEAPTGFAHAVAIHHRRKERVVGQREPGRALRRREVRGRRELLARLVPSMGEQGFSVRVRAGLEEELFRCVEGALAEG